MPLTIGQGINVKLKQIRLGGDRSRRVYLDVAPIKIMLFVILADDLELID